MDFTATITRIERDLRRNLPGAAAHAIVVPRPRRPWPVDGGPLRHAGGLLLVTALDGRAHVILTVRAGHLGRHGGQVSLPGGVIEPGETAEDAALREAHEEIGLPIADVRALGALTPIDIPVSGFRLHPVVAAAPQRVPLVQSDGEVAAILEVDLDALVEPGCLRERTILREGDAVAAPAFVVGDREIWGATAMVLAEFLTILGWVPHPFRSTI